MAGLLDFIVSQMQKGQQSRDYQALFNNMLVGTAPGDVNITPRITAPPTADLSQLSSLPPQIAATALGDNLPQPSFMPAPVPIAAIGKQPGQWTGGDNPDLAARMASGAYQTSGMAPTSPQADQLRNLLSGVSAATGYPILSAAAAKQANPIAQSPLGQLAQDRAAGIVSEPDYQALVKKETFLPGQTPESPVGKLAADLRAGRITQKEYDAGLAKETNLPGQGASSTLGKLAEDLKAGRITQKEYDAEFAKETQLPSEPLEQVFDPTSPTGTKYVTRGTASGQPGPMSANSPAPVISETSRVANAARVAAGEPLTAVFPGYRGNVMAQRDQARNDAIDKIISENPGMTPAEAGTELSNRTIAFQSGKRSAGQLNTMLGATKQAVAQLKFNVEKTKEEMGKLGSSDISPIINAIARGEEKWTGNPAYSSLFYYMHATAVESARVLSGGQASTAQLHQGAMEEANKWANINMTPASFKAVGDAMNEEGANKLQTYEDALRSQRVGGNASPGAQPPTGQTITGKPDAQGWITLPNGVRIREKK